MSRYIALAALVFILAVVNWSIFSRETHLKQGQVVYLDTRPVDPRSLMQGDYMDLRFQASDDLWRALLNESEQDLNNDEGFVIMTLDAQRVGTFTRLDQGGQLALNEIRMRYRVRMGKVKLATNAFFFQEGHGKFYESARYGQFRVDAEGELLLAAMFDADLKKIQIDEAEVEK